MHRSKAPDQISGVDAYDLAIGEEVSEDIQGDAVVGIIEHRDQDDAVGDVKVRVAGGEPVLLENNGAGHRKFDDSEGLAILIDGGAQTSNVFSQRLVVGVVRVGLDGGYDRVGSDKAGDVVDVAVSVVAGDA